MAPSNESIRRWLLVCGLLLCFCGLLAAQTTETEEFGTGDFDTLFAEVAGNLETAITGSLAIWRVSIDSQVRSAIEADGIRRTLDYQLDLAMERSDRAAYRYEDSLVSAIEVQTVTGALAPDRINVAAIQSLRDQGDLDYLLDVHVSSVGGRLQAAYRVLDLASGALRTAGFLGPEADPDPRVLRAATDALRAVEPGDRVFPGSVVRYGREMQSDPDTRDAVTLALAARHPSQVLDYQYYSRYVFRGVSEQEELLVRDSGGRHVSSGLRSYLRSIGVNLVLHVLTGPDGTVAKLVELESGLVRGSAIVKGNMTSDMRPIQQADLERLGRVSSAAGTTAIVGQQYTSPSGSLAVLGTGRPAYAARRLLLADYADHLLRSSGHVVLDHAFVNHEMVRIGVEPGARIYFDADSRRQIREHLELDSAVRVDVDGELLSITVVDAETLVTRVILSAAAATHASDFAGRFAREYAGVDGAKRPILLYSLDDEVTGVSYPVRLLVTAREMSLHAHVLDPALTQHLAATGLGRRGSDEFAVSDFEYLASLGMGEIRLLEVGLVAYDDTPQYHGRVLDVSTRTWPMIRVDYDDTVAQEVAREAFADTLQPVDAGRTGRMHFQTTGSSSLPSDRLQAVQAIVESWLSSERNWQIAHPHYEGVLDYDVVVDDHTPAASEIEVFLRVLDAASGRLTVIGFVGVEDRVRRYDAPRTLGELDRLIAASERLSGAGGPTAVLVNPSFVREEPAVLANAIKQRLHEREVPLVDTVPVNSVSSFNDARVIYELGADRYLIPESYTHGISLKAFDAGGLLTAVEQWADEDVYEALAALDGLPALRSVAVGDLSLQVETTYEQVSLEESFVKDAVLASLIRSGSTELVDARWAPLFLNDPDTARYRVDATLIDNPVLFSINPSLLVVSRRTGDHRWFHVAELPVPESFYSAAPGSYIQTVVDEISAHSAREIVDALRTDGIDGEVVISLDPTVFRFEQGPNSILVQHYRDPQYVIAAKIAAQLYRLMPETELLVHRHGRPQEPDAVIPEFNFQEWTEEFRPPASYERTYRVLQFVTRSGRRIGRGMLEPDGRVSAIPPDQILRAGQLQALQALADAVDQADRYAESVRIADLESKLAAAYELLPRVAVFNEFHAQMQSRVTGLTATLQELQGAATTQSAAAEAIVLIGSGEYRAARDLLRRAIRDLGEEEILVGLLQQAEDLPRGIVGRLPSSAPLNNQAFREFSVAGAFGEEVQEIKASINVRPSGVYRVRVSGPAVVSFSNLSSDGTRIVTGHPEYVVVANSDVPVELTVTNTGRRVARSFTISFERDNDALYRLTEERGELATTTPATTGGVEEIIIPTADPQQYRRHRFMTGAGWLSARAAIVSSTIAGFLLYAETTDFFGHHADFASAQADYAAAVSTSSALEAASRAENAAVRQRLFRRALYGSAITGGATGLIAGILFLTNSGYPSLDVESALFRVGFDGGQTVVSFQLPGPTTQ